MNLSPSPSVRSSFDPSISISRQPRTQARSAGLTVRQYSASLARGIFLVFFPFFYFFKVQPSWTSPWKKNGGIDGRKGGKERERKKEKEREKKKGTVNQCRRRPCAIFDEFFPNPRIRHRFFSSTMRPAYTQTRARAANRNVHVHVHTSARGNASRARARRKNGRPAGGPVFPRHFLFVSPLSPM